MRSSLSPASCSSIQAFQEKLTKEANDDVMSLVCMRLKKAAGCKSLLKDVKLIPPAETHFFKRRKRARGGVMLDIDSFFLLISDTLILSDS